MTSRLSPHLDIFPAFVSSEWKAVEFKASDGIHLRGWFFESTSNRAVIKPIEWISLDPNRKLLFLHGKLDETTPLINSKQLLKKANKQNRLIVFEGGNHIETFKSNPDLYRKEVYQFLETELNK